MRYYIIDNNDETRNDETRTAETFVRGMSIILTFDWMFDNLIIDAKLEQHFMW